MAENKDDDSIFSGAIRAFRKRRPSREEEEEGKALLINQPSKINNPFYSKQERQQEFLDFQSDKIAKDLYSRSIYYEADRFSAYNDYRAMDSSPEVSAALDILSDESITKSETGEILGIFSDNARVKRVLNDLFYRTLNVNFNLGFWARELFKFGDMFLKLEIDKVQGIYDVVQMPVAEVHREETLNGPTGSFRFKWDVNSLFFEEWQVAHFRLISDSNRLPYGRSILEPARKLWKQLQLAEDAMLVYRACLHGETRIRTNQGYKYIKDIKEGDIVMSYNRNAEVESSKVIYSVNNGIKKLLKIKSLHNEIVCSETHPILVNTNGVIHYVDAKDLQIKTDKFINVNTSDFNVCEKKIDRIYTSRVAKFNNNGLYNFRNYKSNKSEIFKSVGEKYNYAPNRIKQFAYSTNKVIPFEIAQNFCEVTDMSIDNLDVLNKGEVNFGRINLPEYVNEEIARLLGFLIGDGFVTKNGGSFGFASGIDEKVNKYYKSLLEKYFGRVFFSPDKRSKKGCGKYCVSSKVGATILKNLGINDTHDFIRIPEWVFNLPKNKRKEFVLGLSDADGCERYTNKGTWFSTIELSNKHLVEDIKELWHSIGFNSGHLKERNRKGGHFIDGRKMPPSKSYQVTLSELSLPQYENIIKIEDAGEDYVYDISVDNDLHNFIANGIPVHNTRAPERRVFFIEIGNIDPADIPQFMEQAKAQLKKAPMVNPATGNVNLKYSPLPVWKNTPIPLLDGRTITIEELAKEFESGKENEVYSIQDNTHSIVGGKVVWCGKNYTATNLTKVWLDDNTWVLTAPEHPFVLRDGSAVRADELKEGDALMPYYESESTIYKNAKYDKTYKTIYNPSSGKYEFVHRLVSVEIPKGNEKHNTVHHKNFNRYDNRNVNLEWVDFHEHRKMHSEVSTKNIIKWNKSDEKIQRVSNSNKERNSVEAMSWYNTSELHKEHDEIRRESLQNRWNDEVKREELKESMRFKFNSECFDLMVKEIQSKIDFINADDFVNSLKNTKVYDVFKKLNKNFKRNPEPFFSSRHSLVKILNDNNIDSYNDFLQKYNPKLLEIKKQNYSDRRKAWNKNNVIRNKSTGQFEYKNHKVLRVENIEMTDDVYCMTVEGYNGENDRHNFALYSFDASGNRSTSGVFVKNTYEEDFYLPVRGDKSSRIETLPGASNLDAIADIEYLQNKLFAALKVPKPYLNYAETIPGGSALAQADLRFSRTINRLQQFLVMELRRIANIHLYFLGLEDDMDNFQLTLTNPSTQQELLKLETMKARLEVFQTMFTNEVTSPVSYTWAMQNIMGFSEQDIKQILRQKKIERRMFSEIEGATDEYTETGIFSDLDRKFRKPGWVPNANPEAEQGSADAGAAGGIMGGGMGLGGGMDMSGSGGADAGMDAGSDPGMDLGPDAGMDLGGGEEIPGEEETEEEPLAERKSPVIGDNLRKNNSKVNYRTRTLMESIDRHLKSLDEGTKIDDNEGTKTDDNR